jgi:hypothetical protein
MIYEIKRRRIRIASDYTTYDYKSKAAVLKKSNSNNKNDRAAGRTEQNEEMK